MVYYLLVLNRVYETLSLLDHISYLKVGRKGFMTHKRVEHNDAILNVSNVEDYEDVIDLLELFRAILKHIKLIIVLCILFGVGS